MKTALQRAQKRHKREHRAKKGDGSWYCSNCRGRHPHNHRCPVPKRRLSVDPDRVGTDAMMAGMLAAIAAAEDRRK